MSKAIIPKHEALLVDADASNRREVVAAVLRMLEEDRRLAYATKQPAVAVSASVAIAKLLDLFDAAGMPVSPVTIVIDGDDAKLL
jgi:hypothetical protein